MLTYTFRLKPGQDVFLEIERFVRDHSIQAGCVLATVGSLAHVLIRLADRESPSEFEGPFEIVSLTGTLSTFGSHLHISVSDEDGRTLGGHLLDGCKIYTTAEIVLAAFEDVTYRRELLSNDSGYEELVVHPR